MHSLSQPSDEGRLPIEEVSDPESYALVCSQLRAAMEKRAMQLSKSVINDLERRLLQRQKTGWFETFLVAIVLLNCVERTCWLFRSWDSESFAQRVSVRDRGYRKYESNIRLVAPRQASAVLLQPVGAFCRHSAHALEDAQSAS